MHWTETENRWVEVNQTLRDLKLLRFENLATASQYWIVYEKFLNYANSGVKVLDWGCGDGHFSYFLLNQGFKAESFSVNSGDAYHPEGCKIAEFLTSQFQDAFNFQVSSGDPVHLPYEDATFDAVVSVGVLEHVRQEGGDELKSLKEIRRILKNNGVFLCFHFPNQYSWVEALARRIPAKHHHLYRFTKKDIRSLNEAAGLMLEEMQGYAFLPRNELARLPESLKNSPWFVKSYNALDQFFYRVLPPFFQNYYFISRKTD